MSLTIVLCMVEAFYRVSTGDEETAEMIDFAEGL
jgi:hypothetical protein